ncbi:MAG: DUF262 domain-containing protein, partial [Bacteroidales bacterium]|nr:DUF262 domain-containing protein [Bacteroidales bacterium]
MSNKNWIVLKDLRKGGQGDSLHFVVPIYQRVFAWGSKEVERLLHDLYCHFVINARTEEDYHLGVITVVRDAKGQMILVDGQQRLTCLMLLGAVLGLELDVQKLDYESRPKDRKALDRIRAILASPGEVSGSGNEAMDSFVRCARTYKASQGKNEELDDDKDSVLVMDELKKVKDTIADRLKLFVSTLPDNPYCKNAVEQNRYFEKMNAGGRQLEPHEILKVRICSKILGKNIDPFDVWNGATDFSEAFHLDKPLERVADRQSETFDDVIFSKKEEPEIGGEPFDDGEETLPTRSGLIELQMFLLHVLAICNNQYKLDARWSDEKLLDSFPAEDGISPDWATKFVKCMEDYRKFLDEKIIHLVFDTAQNSYDYRMNEDDDSDKEESNIDRKIRQFQAMMFVANRGKQGKQEWLLEAFKRWNDSQNNSDPQKNDPSQNLEMLKEIDLKLYATEARCASTYIDNLCYSDQSRWLFWRIDYLLWEHIVNAIDVAHTMADVEF